MSRASLIAATWLATTALACAAPAWAQHEGHTMPASSADPHAAHAMDMDMPMGAETGDPHAGHQMPPAGGDPHAHHAAPPAGTTPLPSAPGGDDPHAGHHAMPAPPAPDPHAGHAAPTVETPPPPEAGSGPPRAADAIWGAEAMRAAREANRREMGAMRWGWLMAERLEYRAGDGPDLGLWDVQGYVGGDIDKLWFKSEGELEWGGKVHEAEVQALWSHAVAPFFDLQLGVRQDLAGPARTHAAIGIQGLAPYQFEIDAAAFLSNRGDLTARIEAELDQRITERLILQPRAELHLSAQHIPALGIGAGLDRATLGLRLRYEFAREFAPYIGLEQSWRAGKGADHARAAGEDPFPTQLVVGLRFWF